MGLKSEVVVWYFGMRTMINNFYLFLLRLEKICTFPLAKGRKYCSSQITNSLQTVILFKEVRPKGQQFYYLVMARLGSY